MLIQKRNPPASDMPEVCSGVFREEFGLNDPEYNHWLTQRLLSSHTYVEQNLPGAIRACWPGGITSRLFSSTTPESGRYYVISTLGASGPSIIHHARYKKSWVRWLKHELIRDVQIWTSTPAPTGYHDWLLFNAWSLRRRALATDNLVAEDSCRFWFPRLIEARRRQLPLTMIDPVHQRVQAYDPAQWVAFREQARERGRGRWQRSQASIVIGLDALH